MSRQGHSGFRDWAGIILLAATSAVCLLLYFFPKEPQGLVGLSEPAGRCEWTGKREVFLGSGLLLGMGYSCMEIIGQPAEFYSDFSMPVLHGEDSVRLWIDPKDRDRLLKAKAEGSDERMRVKVHRIDVLELHWMATLRCRTSPRGRRLVCRWSIVGNTEPCAGGKENLFCLMVYSMSWSWSIRQSVSVRVNFNY